MSPSRASAAVAIATFMAGFVLAPMAAAPIAHADPDPFADPRINIYNTVDKDLGTAGCNTAENRPLEDAAQAYAASENPADGRPANYNGKTAAFLGSGDPQAAAINSAYRNGAGAVIQHCQFSQYGVGFLRKDHGNGAVDVVTIVFGTPAPAPPPKPDPVLVPIQEPDLPPVVSTPPAHVTTPVLAPPPPVPTATVNGDVDLYDKPNVPDGAGKKLKILRKNTVVKVVAPCPSDDWCLLVDPAGAAWGSFFNNN